ncbi:hypothetical protein ACFL5V_12245, partial [Fibrobacterota bacterium]
IFIPQLTSDATFGGVVLASINLEAFLDTLGRNLPRPFLIHLKEDEIYSQSWDHADGFIQKPLQIPGAPDLSVSYYFSEEDRETQATAGGPRKNRRFTATEAVKEYNSGGKESEKTAPPPRYAAGRETSPKARVKSVFSGVFFGVLFLGILVGAVSTYLLMQGRREKDSIL